MREYAQEMRGRKWYGLKEAEASRAASAAAPRYNVRPMQRRPEMSAIPEDLARRTRELAEEVTRPFPNSRRVYVRGSRADLRVPMREIAQSPTKALTGDIENPPITVYDTSGPYTDPEARIDLR